MKTLFTLTIATLLMSTLSHAQDKGGNGGANFSFLNTSNPEGVCIFLAERGATTKGTSADPTDTGYLIDQDGKVIYQATCGDQCLKEVTCD